MYLKLFFAALLFNPLIIFGQNISGAYSLCGEVLDSDSIPIPGALIQLHSKFSTSTNSDGNFCFQGLQKNSYSLRISSVGFEVENVNVILSKNENFKIILNIKTEQLKEIKVIYNREEARQDEGYSVEIIPIKALQSQSITLNRVLDQVAGVRVKQNGGLGSRAQFTMNGLSGNSIRFFMDGVPLEYFGSSYSISTIPIDLIDRIEVYKGVIPVALSNDVLGGAVNLISKKEVKNKLRVSYSLGSFNTHRASVFGNYRNKKNGTTVNISAFYNHSDNNYEVWGDNITLTNPETFEIIRGIKVKRFHDNFSSQSIKTEIGFTQVKWADILFAGLLLSRMDKEIQHGTTMNVPFGEATYNQNLAMPFIQYQKSDVLKNLDINVFGSYSILERTHIDTTKNIYNWLGNVEGYRSLGGEQKRSLNVLNQSVILSRVNLNYRLSESHSITSNLLYSSLNRSESDPLITNKTEGYWAPQNFNKNTGGLAWKAQWLNQKLNTTLFTKYFAFQAGIKTSQYEDGEIFYNNASQSYSNFGFGFAGTYQLNAQIKLNASAELASRLPEPNEVLGDGILILSTTELRAEESTNINVGVIWKTKQLGKLRIKISSHYFHRNVKDIIQPWQFDQNAFVYINFDKVEINGIDTQVDLSWNNILDFNQSISYTNPIIKSEHDEFGHKNILYNTILPNTPLFQSNSYLGYKVSNLFQKNSKAMAYWSMTYITQYYRYAENIGKYNKDIIPSQLVNNFGFGYTFPTEKMSLGVDVQNIFNKQVFDNFSIQKPGRSLYLKLSIIIS